MSSTLTPSLSHRRAPVEAFLVPQLRGSCRCAHFISETHVFASQPVCAIWKRTFSIGALQCFLPRSFQWDGVDLSYTLTPSLSHRRAPVEAFLVPQLRGSCRCAHFISETHVFASQPVCAIWKRTFSIGALQCFLPRSFQWDGVDLSYTLTPSLSHRRAPVEAFWVPHRAALVFAQPRADFSSSAWAASASNPCCLSTSPATTAAVLVNRCQ